MALLRGTVVPRVLLGVLGVLSLLWFISAIQLLVASGPSSDSLLICLISGGQSIICLWAAAGKTDIFAR